MQLNAEQLQYFSAMEGTFLTPGWTLISKGWKDERDQLADRMFFNAKSYEDVEHARVRFGLLNELISLPNMIQVQKDQVLAEEEDE